MARGAGRRRIFSSWPAGKISSATTTHFATRTTFGRRLARAIDVLEQAVPGVPALYGSRTRLIDENGKTTGFSPLFPKPATFRSALVQNIAGGNVYYDAYPSLRYRQHGQNVIGSNMGFAARMRRLRMLRQGRFRHWADLSVVALARLRPRMSAENQKIFDLFCKARHRPLLQRAAMFAQTGVYRQTLLGNLGLAAAVVLRKI
jgi:hypothetical protein